ncbi:putative nucleic acid-binding protein [Allostreptomyces psammosilenae]|uniref:Putative nucleic acid-binding protein n=2 Tax=Allostreptomyces psammosilenae TaxID=1892865 RepID=A0A853A100_9ACTN|nr:putative nucleic acid-binding protein [Allostreptomyces psammosilenae]
MRIVASTLTVVEVRHARVREAQLNWYLSAIKLVPVSAEIAGQASTLLLNAGLHGHRYAIDAVVAATALDQPGAVMLVTSDVDDMTKLCADHQRTAPFKIVGI